MAEILPFPSAASPVETALDRLASRLESGLCHEEPGPLCPSETHRSFIYSTLIMGGRKGEDE